MARSCCHPAAQTIVSWVDPCVDQSFDEQHRTRIALSSIATHAYPSCYFIDVIDKEDALVVCLRHLPTRRQRAKVYPVQELQEPLDAVLELTSTWYLFGQCSLPCHRFDDDRRLVAVVVKK